MFVATLPSESRYSLSFVSTAPRLWSCQIASLGVPTKRGRTIPRVRSVPVAPSGLTATGGPERSSTENSCLRDLVPTMYRALQRLTPVVKLLLAT